VIRSIAAVLVLGLALVACGGGGTSAEPGNSTGGEAAIDIAEAALAS
jgi:hypothetical protein